MHLLSCGRRLCFVSPPYQSCFITRPSEFTLAITATTEVSLYILFFLYINSSPCCSYGQLFSSFCWEEQSCLGMCPPSFCRGQVGGHEWGARSWISTQLSKLLLQQDFSCVRNWDSGHPLTPTRLLSLIIQGKSQFEVRVLCKLGCNHLPNIRSPPLQHKPTLAIPDIDEWLTRQKDEDRSMQATTIASNLFKRNSWACSYACGHTSPLYLLITAFLPATSSWTCLPVSFRIRQKSRDILQFLSFRLKQSRKDWPRCWGGALKMQLDGKATSSAERASAYLLSSSALLRFMEERDCSWAALCPQYWDYCLDCCCSHLAALHTHHTQYRLSAPLPDQRQRPAPEAEALSCYGGWSPAQVLWHWNAQARLVGFSELPLS